MTKILPNLGCDEMCRACLKCIKEEPKYDDYSIIELYQNITQIRIFSRDDLPQNMCKTCRNKIKNYNTFREQCLSNEEALLDYLNNKKDETLINPEPIVDESVSFQSSECSWPPVVKEISLSSNSCLSPSDLECTHCDEFFKNQALLKSHVEEYHKKLNVKVRINKCKDTLKSLPLKTKLQSCTFKNKIAHICPICKLEFNSFPKLLLHMEIHPADGPLQCEKCPKNFRDYKALIRHHKNHAEKPFLCYNCGKTFQRSGDFAVHMRTHTGEKPYECGVCHKKFKTSYMCIVHKRLHTGEKPSECQKCHKRFVSSSHLYIHMRSHNKNRPYTCKECGKAFAQEKDLKIHTTLHSGQTLFQCETCGRGFNRKNNLSKHVKLHQGIKTHICQTCSFAFPTSTQLKTHLRTHTGDRPYKCDLCPAKFASSSGVSRHKKIHQKQGKACSINSNNLVLDHLKTTERNDETHDRSNILDTQMEILKDTYDPKNNTENVYIQDMTHGEQNKVILYELYENTNSYIVDDLDIQKCTVIK